MEQSLTICKASAGSGKTFALTVEYIMELLQPNAEHEFKHTLAVTFTNKATAEMKSRILETLYGLKMGLKESEPYLEAIQKKRKANPLPDSSPSIGKGFLPIEEASFIRQQAGKALTAILHDYSHFRVETIDSFFQSILRNMARELGLSANLQVELSHDEIIESAVDSLIETMDTKPEVRQWVLDYVHEQLNSGDKWDIVGPLKAFAENIFREEYQRRSEEELRRLGDAEAIKAFKSRMYAIRENALKKVEEAVDNVMNLIEDFSQISYGKNLQSFLIKARAMESDGPGKSVLNSRFKVQSSSTFDLQARLAEFTSLYEKCRKEYLSATLALRHLGPLRLLNYIDERAREIEGDAGRFTLSSTPALLSKMVEGSDAPFIFEKIGTFINNVMIDEFQDTSRMQWENFKKLLFEKLASGGKGLLVGDIKQSIYRWRNGDWKILYGIEKEKDLQRFHITPDPLDINYRSHQVIVEFNNKFFLEAASLLDKIASPEGKDSKPLPSERGLQETIKLSHIYEDVGQKIKKDDGKGYVRVSLFKETDDYVQDTIADMAEQINNLLSDGLDLSQIAILVRTNRMAQQLVEGFGLYAPHIRLVSDEAFLLDASISVQMIVAAMRMLIDKNHTDGISEKYLMLHYQYDVLGKTDMAFHNLVLQDAADVLPEAFTAHRDELLQLPLYLLAERLWHIFSLSNIKGEDVYVQTFFDELQNHLRSAGTPDIETFLNAWDQTLRQRSIPASSVAGVRILTIHKSKGLAFHTVLLPFSHWDIEKDRQGDVLWCSTDESSFGELGTLPISIHSKAVRTSVFSSDYDEEHLERRVDALNTLYVAFTRAKCNLYLWGKVKLANNRRRDACVPTGEQNDKDKNKNIATASELIYMTLRTDENDTDPTRFTYEEGTPLTEVDNKEKEMNRLRLEHEAEDAIEVKVVTRPPVLSFLQSNQAQEYLQELASDSEAWTGSSQRDIGKRMHEVLSRVDDVSQIDEVFSQAREEGIVGEGKEWDDIILRIRQGLENPLVASWFSQKNTAVYNECSIASTDKDGLPCVLRPDRVVVNAGIITVIDYKFGHPSKLYSDQVQAYMKLLRQMYPKHTVQGYIWYVLAGGARKVEN